MFYKCSHSARRLLLNQLTGFYPSFYLPHRLLTLLFRTLKRALMQLLSFHDSTESYYGESRNHLETENISIISPGAGQSATDRRQLEATTGSEGWRGGEAASAEGNWQQRLGGTLAPRAEGVL